MINSEELKAILLDYNLVSHIRADQKVKNAFIAFHHQLNQPRDVIAAVFSSLVDYVAITRDGNSK